MENQNYKQIFIVPMRGCPVFPGMYTTVEVSDPVDIQSVKEAETQNGFGLLLLKGNAKPEGECNKDNFYEIGTFVRVKNKLKTIYGSTSLYLETICRFRVIDIFNSDRIICATVEFIQEDQLNQVKERAYIEVLRKNLSMRDDHSVLVENIRFNASNISEAIRLTDYLASVIVDKNRQQEFLETLNAEERIMKILQVLQDDLAVQKMHNQILNSITQKVDARQREFYLREEMKVIKKQLEDIGNTVPEDNENNPIKPKLLDRLQSLHLEGETYETVFSEYQKMENMESVNPEYSILRSYLETVADLPWNTFSEDNYDIEKAREILEHDHYGIKDVKERVLEFLAVRDLKKDTKGSIICLVGPPGTGKTSVGISIAKALNKQYYRFSVGGMRDEAEIKGHRRTYIGSMPGQIIKGLRVTKTKNPVFVIDEIDKMTVSNQGDPSAALLEVLDPEQNTSFRDHYLDIPFDISNVLFVVTANTTDSIPRPLLDRMECIELNGYTSEEKLHIGKKYLVPKSRTKHGLKTSDIKYSDKILRKVAEEYAREAGVRNFEKALDKIHRKVAMELVQASYSGNELQKPIVIDDEKLIKYLGQPIFREDELLKADKPGMSIGLAWTSMGGDVLAIEAQHIPGKGDLHLTGQLGDVMKESASIAFSYIKSIAGEYGIKPEYFKENNIHLHVPEGATPKDGPSAGITMATAIFSLVTGKIMAPDMAMTGELSLLGKVMPIGGLKEKVLAAKRNKVKTVIIPKFNQRDLDKLEDHVKKGVKFVLVSDMEEVLKIAFGKRKSK